MDRRIQAFFESVKGKTVAFCGIGGSNLPLDPAICGKRARSSPRGTAGHRTPSGIRRRNSVHWASRSCSANTILPS